MSNANAPERAIADARALLAELISTAWDDIHIDADGVEVFIATGAGRPNPMVRQDVSEPDELQVVLAPHVATLLSVVGAGTIVARGQAVAMIEVLGTQTEIHAAVDGIVRDGRAAPGDLLQFGSEVLTVVVQRRPS